MIINPLIIAAILAAAFTMIFFSYMSKNNERSEQDKARRITKLKERARKLDSVIAGLPPEYLPKTLKELIYSSIIDSLQQIHGLTGNDSLHAQIESIRKTLANLTENTALGTSDNQTSLVEIKEYKYLLKDLHVVIVELHSEGLITKNILQTHVAVLKALFLKVSLATYKVAASNALEVNNVGLALHYCQMAKAGLEREPGAQGLDAERIYFGNQVASLEQRALAEGANAPGSGPENEADEAVLAQWQALESSENEWKKKRY